MTLALAGCATAPAPKPAALPSTPPPPPRVSAAAAESTSDDVSEPMSLDVSKPINTVSTNVFPMREQVGYRIALAYDLSLPAIVAKQASNKKALVIVARVYNRSEESRTLDFICEVNDPKFSHQLTKIHFPPKKARDLRLRIDDPPDGSILWFLVKDTKGTVAHSPDLPRDALTSIKID